MSHACYSKGEFIQQHPDLSAQYGGQQGHSDVHAVLCLTEICRPWVCVHLHTERNIQERREEVTAEVLSHVGCTSTTSQSILQKDQRGGLLLNHYVGVKSNFQAHMTTAAVIS